MPAACACKSVASLARAANCSLGAVVIGSATDLATDSVTELPDNARQTRLRLSPRLVATRTGVATDTPRTHVTYLTRLADVKLCDDAHTSLR
ncbi:hypothetical protein GCM10009020_19600 [Natronoarchaeum mannanilyticum]|uniref:Uncharacterized protein n=1 Tax=Natronoarchaeum mannanilyticum TaxID=926360 RepID=A0AAV3TBZ9_9EURY